MFFCPICLWLFRCSTVFTLQSYHNRTKPKQRPINFHQRLPGPARNANHCHHVQKKLSYCIFFPGRCFVFPPNPGQGLCFPKHRHVILAHAGASITLFFPLLSRHAKTHMLSERGKTTRVVAKRPKEAPRSAHTHSHDGRRLTGVVVSLAKR